VNTYEIYHAINIMAMLDPDPQDWLEARSEYYQHVATIHIELEWVFFMTQHTDGRNWTERREVSWVTPEYSPRSTSVGDVIYEPQTSQAWLVGHCDLEEIERTD
jgi:hypothetical protein